VIKPREALFSEERARRRQVRGAFECANMEVRFVRQPWIAAGERGAAAGAEAALHAGRGFILRDFALGYRNCIVSERDKDRCRRAAVSATALAMTPKYPFGFPHRFEANIAAHAVALENFLHSVLR